MALDDPKRRPTQRQPAALLLVVDRSAAMAGAPMAATVDAISKLLGQLRPDDRLGLILFNGRPFLPAPIAAVRSDPWIARVLSQFEPRGEADLCGAIERAITECRRERGRDLVLVSAGRPTLGLRRDEQLERVAALGRREGVRISAVAVGPASGRKLLQRVSHAGGGAFAAAPDSETLHRALMRAVERNSSEERPEARSRDHDPGRVDE